MELESGVEEETVEDDGSDIFSEVVVEDSFPGWAAVGVGSDGVGVQ